MSTPEKRVCAPCKSAGGWRKLLATQYFHGVSEVLIDGALRQCLISRW